MPVLPKAQATALTIGSFDGALEDGLDACDLRRLSFIDAYGLVGTACALRLARSQMAGVRVHLPEQSGASQHLSTMGFIDFLADLDLGLSSAAIVSADASDVVVPLMSAADAGGAQALSALLWEQLRAHVDPQVLQAVAEGVWEMVANALEHSGTDALIMGQVYWRRRGGKTPHHDDRVQVVIGDVGRGIRASFLETGVHNPTDDREAIHLALKYLVTSVPNDRGRGQGLSTTMEEVVALRGRMYVRSGTAMVAVDSERTQDTSVRALPGVIVALSLPLYPG